MGWLLLQTRWCSYCLDFNNFNLGIYFCCAQVWFIFSSQVQKISPEKECKFEQSLTSAAEVQFFRLQTNSRIREALVRVNLDQTMMIGQHKNDNVNITFVKEPYKHYHKHMFRLFQIFQNSIKSLIQHVLECFWPISNPIHAVSIRIAAYSCNPLLISLLQATKMAHPR